tara:strand:+ start:1996 stop:2334 length:339 start_codon:yes stop_codon:yes gene_type:complete
MKIYSCITKNNWKELLESRDLNIEFNDYSKPCIAICFLEKLIFYIEIQEITDHIEINYKDFYKEICYTDEDGDKEVDVRVYEEMNFKNIGNAEIVISMYLDTVDELYSNLND